MTLDQETLQARVKRLEQLANTADDTDEYCRLLAKLQTARLITQGEAKMTRKEYEAIAAALHLAGIAVRIGAGKSAEYAIRLAATHIAATMARDNPRFDRARFLKACGVQS